MSNHGDCNESFVQTAHHSQSGENYLLCHLTAHLEHRSVACSGKRCSRIDDRIATGNVSTVGERLARDSRRGDVDCGTFDEPSTVRCDMDAYTSKMQKRKPEVQAGTHVGWGELLIILGLIGALAGSLDPLEGAVFVLPGVALISLGTILSKSQLKMLAFWSCVLTAIGIGAMIGLSSLGGIGGDSGLSIWWALVLTPYPVGAVLSFVSGAIALLEKLGAAEDSAQTHR
jgi:hypothetical protein